jgi:protein gp37
MAARLEAMGMEKYRGVAVRVGSKGKWTGQVNFSTADLVKPLTVRKPGRWFLTSMGDVAHEKLSEEQIAEMFGVMAVAGAIGPFHREQDGYTVSGSSMASGRKEVPVKRPNMLSGPHTFMALTKRTDRMADLISSQRFRDLVASAAHRWAHNRVAAGALSDGIKNGQYWPMPNVLIGATVENQEQADLRRPHMARIAVIGWHTFVSYEPALAPVDWSGWEFLKQLISGGESGPKARPSHPVWHRGARDFAEEHDIAYLFKQWGEWAPGENSGGAQTRTEPVAWLNFDNTWEFGKVTPKESEQMHTDDSPDVWRFGKKTAGRLLDGRTHDGFPDSAIGTTLRYATSVQ